MNPVNSERHMHYIHLVIKEQHCSGECLQTACYQWLLSNLLYICIHLLLNYTQNVGSPYTCPNTERSFLEASCYVENSIWSTIKTLSNSDWYTNPKRVLLDERHKTWMNTAPTHTARPHSSPKQLSHVLPHTAPQTVSPPHSHLYFFKVFALPPPFLPFFV